MFYRFDNFIRNAHSQVSYHIPDNLVGSLFYLHSRYESLTFFQSPLFTPNQSAAPPSGIATKSNTLFSILNPGVSTKSLVPSSQCGKYHKAATIYKTSFKNFQTFNIQCLGFKSIMLLSMSHTLALLHASLVGWESK